MRRAPIASKVHCTQGTPGSPMRRAMPSTAVVAMVERTKESRPRWYRRLAMQFCEYTPVGRLLVISPAAKATVP